MANRVLYLLPSGQNTEAVHSTLQPLRCLDPDRWDIRIFFLADGPMVREAGKLGFKCQVFHSVAFNWARPGKSVTQFLQKIHAVAEYVRQEKIGVIHSVNGAAHRVGRAASALTGAPEIWSQHELFGLADAITARLRTSALLVPGEFARAEAMKFLPNASRVRIVVPGSDAESSESPSLRFETRARFGIRDEMVAFGMLAPMNLVHGHQLLVEAAALVQGTIPFARFLIWGAASTPAEVTHLREMKELAHSLGLRDRVIFGGEPPSARAGLTALDVLVNCSLVPQAFPCYLTEAMMLGKPVIAPRWGGALEIITPEGDGLFFDPVSSDDLADRLLELSGTAEERASFGVPARANALERFNAERVARELETEYARALGLGLGLSGRAAA